MLSSKQKLKFYNKKIYKLFRYGRPSGELAGTTLNTVGNLYHVSHNINYMTPKGIAKHTIKGTGNAMVEDFRNELRRPSASHLQNNLYPNVLEGAGPSTSTCTNNQNVLPKNGASEFNQDKK